MTLDERDLSKKCGNGRMSKWGERERERDRNGWLQSKWSTSFSLFRKGDHIQLQESKMGCSVDWDRAYFTMNDVGLGG